MTRKIRASGYLMLLLAASVIAAEWHGVFDTNENPRTWNNTQIIEFIYGTVNLSVDIWRRGDTFTLCQANSTTCILVACVNPLSSAGWAKGRNVDSRQQPVAPDLWEQFINWLWGQGTSSITDAAMVYFLWGYEVVPVGAVSIGPLMPINNSVTSVSCESCHGS